MRAGDQVLTYIIERELGEGGMGTVYLGRHTILSQQVAIKALSPLLARDPAVRERFIQEANIQATLRHPGIVLALNAGFEGEQPVLVMEYIEGKSLFEVLELRGELPLDDTLKIMEQVFSAVGYAHRQGVIHRDLKPENIMVTAVGDVKVTDFGIAKVLGSARLTRTGTIMGSVYYMSPEQILNPETVDARSDIYSLGCVFYELLTGSPPFGEKHASGTDNEFKLKSAHVNEAAPVLKADVPDWLAQMVMTMLEKESERRPPSCEAILDKIKANDSSVSMQYSEIEENSDLLQLAPEEKQHQNILHKEDAVHPIERRLNKLFDKGFKVAFILLLLCASIFFSLSRKVPNEGVSDLTQPSASSVEHPEKIEESVPEKSRELVVPDADNQRWKFNYYALEKPLLSKLADSRKVMQVTLTVMTHYDDRVIKNVKTHEFALRAGILDVMREKTEADTRNSDFRKILAEEVRLTINSLLEKYEGFGGIEEVMFTEFVVQ
jgi:serine/threonine-protein kinase